MEKECPATCNGYVQRRMEDIIFPLRIKPLGEDNDTVELSATVPVFKCDTCGFEYTNYEADDIREQVVNDYRSNL